MITVIEGMPACIIGFRLHGQVTAEDYETVLAPTAKAALDAGSVRLLYVLADETSYDLDALWADTKLWAGNLRGWERVAVVSDADWLENAVKAFGWMMPGEVKVFDDDDEDEARA